MTKKILFATAGAFALALAGCGDGQTDTATTDTMAADPAATGTADAAAQPAAAQQFVDSVAASDAYEIEAARLAQQNGTSEEVRTFAQMMIEDHTNSTNNLRDAVAQVNGVTVNPQMTPQQQQNIQALRDAGDNFDQVYAQQQVAAHEQALTLLRDYATNGEVESLRTFAETTATVVEGHLNHARELPQ